MDNIELWFKQIELRFNQFADVNSILEIAALIFIVALLSETAWDFYSGFRKKSSETIANFLIGFGNILLERTFFGVVFVIGLFLVEPFAFATIPMTWWSMILAVLVADLSYYWMHRTEHRVRILWAFHNVHHSSPEFNFSTSLRLAWFEGAVEWLFFVPMILIGFDPAQTIVAFLIVVAYQSWVHTERVGKLGILDRIFNTPSVHRVHHGTNTQYIDKNYGGIFIIWDRIFGTYEPEKEKVTYGITEPLNSSNPLTINFLEFRNIWRDVRRAKKWSHKFGYIFYPPGWKPEQEDQKNKVMLDRS